MEEEPVALVGAVALKAIFVYIKYFIKRDF